MVEASTLNFASSPMKKSPFGFPVRLARFGVIAIFPLLLVSLAPQARADLVWNATFDAYDTSGGPVEAVVNASGSNDTFRNLTTSGVSGATFEIVGSGVPDFMTGNALFIEAPGTGAPGVTARINQSALASLEADGVYIVSYDLLKESRDSFSANTVARSGNNNAGSASAVFNTSTEPLRVTFVVNRTADPITLPGDLGDLPANHAVTYLNTGTKFTSGGTVDLGDEPVTGFGAGISANSGDKTYSGWFDNFGVWNSLSDTVKGVSVLELAPGTVPKP